jgi:hypothetical protein
MLGKIVKFILLSELFAVVTFAFGWWSVAVVAIVWALFSRDRAATRVAWATVCAIAGWAELLAISAARDPVGEVAVRLGEVMRVPAFGLVAITLAFAGMLAWSGSTLAVGVRR